MLEITFSKIFCLDGTNGRVVDKLPGFLHKECWHMCVSYFAKLNFDSSGNCLMCSAIYCIFKTHTRYAQSVCCSKSYFKPNLFFLWADIFATVSITVIVLVRTVSLLSQIFYFLRILSQVFWWGQYLHVSRGFHIEGMVNLQ